MNEFSDQKIIDSWKKNVRPWISAVRNDEIESRIIVTNDAIINAVLNRKPKSILDVGCGEGWLVRKIGGAGVKSMGVDIVPELIEYAKNEGVGEFHVLSYENISPKLIKEKFDVIVFNFSLLGNESVSNLFQKASLLLNKSGVFIIQTIHPIVGCGEEKYEDGWREGSWNGFSKKFVDPAPWYFRTMDSWKFLFLKNNFSLIETQEPINPKTKAPASIIFTAKKDS